MLLCNCPAVTHNIAVITLHQVYFDAKINTKNIHKDIKSYFVLMASDFKLQKIKKSLRRNQEFTPAFQMNHSGNTNDMMCNSFIINRA